MNYVIVNIYKIPGFIFPQFATDLSLHLLTTATALLFVALPFFVFALSLMSDCVEGCYTAFHSWGIIFSKFFFLH